VADPTEKKRAKAERACQEWNDLNPVGTPVNLTRDDGGVQQSKTRSEAYVCDSGYPVIFLEGVRGYYMLYRVTRTPT
jgi:hypothetical protein